MKAVSGHEVLPLGQFGRRQVAPDRLQCHLGPEIRAVALPCRLHSRTIPSDREQLNTLSRRSAPPHPKAFELYCPRQHLKRIAVLAQMLQVLRQRKQVAWVHQTFPCSPRSESNHSIRREGLLHVSRCLSAKSSFPAVGIEANRICRATERGGQRYLPRRRCNQKLTLG